MDKLIKKLRAIADELESSTVEPHAELKGHLKHLEIAGVWVVCNEPTCQIRNLDTGELKTMTREDAKKLQTELGDTVEWMNPFGQKSTQLMYKDLRFDCDGIYTYKPKAKPLKQVSRDDLPIGVAVTDDVVVAKLVYKNAAKNQACLADEVGVYWTSLKDLKLAPASEQPWLAVQDGETGYGVTQVLQSKGISTALHPSSQKFIVTGLAEGYELK